MDFYQLAQEKRAQILAQTAALVAINSVEDMATADPAGGAPYGKACRQVLTEALDMGRRAGFAVHDFGGHVGRVELQGGEEIFGILAHLDIVPAGEGWLTDPFCMTEKDGYLFGRGVLDDKGPVAAALAAMEIARDLVPRPRRSVHLILGCNEETGMGCMRHYLQNARDLPDFGVTPDNAFPVIFGEKGILRFSLTGPFESAIQSMQAGTRPNVVPNTARAQIALRGLTEGQLTQSLQSYWRENGLPTGEASVQGDRADVLFRGVSCHSQQPQDGVNAASHLFRWAAQALSDPCARTLSHLFGDCLGRGLGIAVSGGPMGELTSSLGLVSMQGGQMELVCDVRYPNDVTGGGLTELLRRTIAGTNSAWQVNALGDTEPLFADPESDFVQLLAGAYRDITGDLASPLGVTGGGTYARMFKNHLAFGPIFPAGGPLPPGVGTLHQANEAILADQLVQLCAIYAKVLYQILQ